MIAWGAGALALGLGSAFYPWLMMLVLGLTIAAGLGLMSLRCEACGYPVYRKKTSIAGADFSYWSPLVGRICGQCGAGEQRDGLDAGSQRRRRMRVVLVFLITVNVIGGIGLAQRVDQRFVWAAVIVPAVCLVVLALTFVTGDARGRARR
jgi:hypothetical protein